jgi:nitrogen fixation protein FixH
MREITGRHVLIGTVAAFGVIIAANVTLAVSAVRTFPGLEVKNSYDASQVFDREKAAQEALGWTMDAGLANGELRIAFTGPDGRAVHPATVTAKVGRATEAVDDHTPDLIWTGDAFSGPVNVDGGNWIVWVDATADDGTAFRQRIPLRTGP